MRIKLSLLKERIRQQATGGDEQFSWNRFNAMTRADTYASNEVLTYCNRRLEKLGEGMGRSVYLLNAKSVLKLARNENGVAQNAHEKKLSNTGLPVARVLSSAAKASWIVSEAVRPVHSEEEFARLSGYDTQDLLVNIVEMSEDAANGSEPKQREHDEFLWSVWKAVKEGDLSTADVTRLSHWGVASDRRLVLLDYGYTNQMSDER